MLKVYDTKTTPIAADKFDLPYDQILIEALVLQAQIGVFDFEYGRTQPVRFDVVVDIEPLQANSEHETHNIVRYDHVVEDIKKILDEGHIDLVETLAERIAAACLIYQRAFQVCVTVAKLDAIEDAKSVGVRITRRKSPERHIK